MTKDTVQWDVNTAFPCANWYKGSLSRTFCDYLEDVTKGRRFDDNLLNMCVEGVQALNSFLRGLYASDIFLDPETARRLGEYGLRFLRRYSQAAAGAQAQGRCLFSLIPKLHCLQHICLKALVLESQSCERVVNPLVYSVQQSEDFIGRNSRVARHVHPRLCSQRVCERFLQHGHSQYVKAGYLPR